MNTVMESNSMVDIFETSVVHDSEEEVELENDAKKEEEEGRWDDDRCCWAARNQSCGVFRNCPVMGSKYGTAHFGKTVSTKPLLRIKVPQPQDDDGERMRDDDDDDGMA